MLDGIDASLENRPDITKVKSILCTDSGKHVRLWNQERREEWEARQAALEAEEAESLQPGFGLPEREE